MTKGSPLTLRIVHHCPKCFKPLTTPQARTRCLGEHVEWCRRYHTQLFKKGTPAQRSDRERRKLKCSPGTSAQCLPCRHGDEEHQKRHREIAELVHKLDLLNTTAKSTGPATPLTPLRPNPTDTPRDLDEEAATPKTKKERKAAKKARKISEMPKAALNAATVEHVGRVLHLNDHDCEDGELELQFLNDDAEIKNNRFFHKGTSNKREIRNEFVKKDRKGDKDVFHVGTKEMEGLLQLLDVSPVTTSTLPEEKRIIEELKQKIEKDLVQAQEENEGFMMRKAGFWRWASKKAYNRLVANGRIWEEKGDGSHAAKSDESGGSTEGDAVLSTDSGDATDDTNITEPDTDGVSEVTESVSTLTLATPKTPKATAAAKGLEHGWMSVSKTKGSNKSKKATPNMKIKLTPNGGLAKMVQSSTPRTTGFLRHHSSED